MVEGRTASESKAEEVEAGDCLSDRYCGWTCFSAMLRGSIDIRAAQANDRSVAVVGRALKRAFQLQGRLHAGYSDMVPEGDIVCCRGKISSLFAPERRVKSGAMAKIAAGMHETVSLDPGDTVIYSSRQIPGNEPAIARVQDMLIRRKINLVTDDDAPVHVPGHPSRDEMIERWFGSPAYCHSRWNCQTSDGACGACRVLPGSADTLPDNGTVIRLADARSNERLDAGLLTVSIRSADTTKDRLLKSSPI